MPATRIAWRLAIDVVVFVVSAILIGIGLWFEVF